MNSIKSQVKILTAEALGRDIEKMIEGAHKKVFLQQGAKEGLELGSSKVSELLSHIDKDLEKGIIGEIESEPLKIAEYVKRYIQRCVGILDNLATQAEVARLICAGQEKGLTESNDFINKFWKEERAKLESLLRTLEEAAEKGGSVEEIGRPAPTLKALRTEEGLKNIDKSEKKKEKAPSKKLMQNKISKVLDKKVATEK